MKKYIADKDCFFIAKNPNYHHGKLIKGQVIDTGQAELQIFDTFDDWRSQLLTDNVITENHEYVDGFWQIIEEAPGNDIPY